MLRISHHILLSLVALPIPAIYAIVKGWRLPQQDAVVPAAMGEHAPAAAE